MAYSYLFPVMLGVYVSGWDLTLVDMRGNSAASVETCMGTSRSARTSGAARLGCCGISGSSISTTCGGGSCPSISNPGSSTFPYGTTHGIFISSSYSSEYTTGNYTSSSSELSPTPEVSMSPMRQPCLSVNLISLGWFLPNVSMQVITVSGMGIKSQFYRAILWPEFNAMDFYPPCIFSLGPR